MGAYRRAKVLLDIDDDERRLERHVPEPSIYYPALVWEPGMQNGGN